MPVKENVGRSIEQGGAPGGRDAERRQKKVRVRDRDRPPQRKPRERRPYHKQTLEEQIEDPAAIGVRVRRNGCSTNMFF